MPTALVMIWGTSSTRGAASSPCSDLVIAVLESDVRSLPAAASSAATRAAAASVGRAPDSSSNAGHTRSYQSACARSQTGEPTSA